MAAPFGYRVLVKENTGNNEKPLLSQSEIFSKREDADNYVNNAVEKFKRFHPDVEVETKEAFGATWLKDETTNWSATLTVSMDYAI